MSPKIVADVGSQEVAALAPRLKVAMAKGQVTGEHMQKAWFDVGTLERLAQVTQYTKGQRSSS